LSGSAAAGFYTDKRACPVAVKSKRQEQREGLDRQEMPPTQIARALGELGIVWIPAHSPRPRARRAPVSDAQDVW